MSGDLELCTHKLKLLLIATEATMEKIRARVDARKPINGFDLGACARANVHCPTPMPGARR